jgi:hypothetical protein
LAFCLLSSAFLEVDQVGDRDTASFFVFDSFVGLTDDAFPQGREHFIFVRKVTFVAFTAVFENGVGS